jgi:hypothetical protein
LRDPGRGLYEPTMKSGIIGAREGYEIVADGHPRSFRDIEANAYEAARFLKTASKYKERVEIVARATCERISIL